MYDKATLRALTERSMGQEFLLAYNNIMDADAGVGGNFLRLIQQHTDHADAVTDYLLSKPEITSILSEYVNHTTNQPHQPDAVGGVAQVDDNNPASNNAASYGCFGRSCSASWDLDGLACSLNCAFGPTHFRNQNDEWVEAAGARDRVTANSMSASGKSEGHTALVPNVDWGKSFENPPHQTFADGTPQGKSGECLALQVFFHTFGIPPAPTFEINARLSDAARWALEMYEMGGMDAAPGLGTTPPVETVQHTANAVSTDANAAINALATPSATGTAPVFDTNVPAPAVPDEMGVVDQLAKFLIDGGICTTNTVNGVLTRGSEKGLTPPQIHKKLAALGVSRGVLENKTFAVIHQSWREAIKDAAANGLHGKDLIAYAKKFYGFKTAIKGSTEGAVLTDLNAITLDEDSIPMHTNEQGVPAVTPIPPAPTPPAPMLPKIGSGPAPIPSADVEEYTPEEPMGEPATELPDIETTVFSGPTEMVGVDLSGMENSLKTIADAMAMMASSVAEVAKEAHARSVKLAEIMVSILRDKETSLCQSSSTKDSLPKANSLSSPKKSSSPKKKAPKKKAPKKKAPAKSTGVRKKKATKPRAKGGSTPSSSGLPPFAQ